MGGMWKVQGRTGAGRVVGGSGTSAGFREEVWSLMLWTCGVTLGCPNLVFGDSERVSLVGGEEKKENFKKHKNNSNESSLNTY